MSEPYQLMLLVHHLSGGGAERVVAGLSKSLDGPFRVYLVTFGLLPDSYEHGGELINLQLTGKGLFGKLSTAFRRIRKVKKLKKSLGIDCCVSFLPNADYVNVFSRGQGKTIVSVRTNPQTAETGRFKRLFRKWVFRRADGIVTLSEGVRQEIIRSFGVPSEKAVTIYNYCAFDTLISRTPSLTSGEIGFDPKLRYILSMGSMRYPKGQWHLLKSFAAVHAKHPETQLVLLGEGGYHDSLKELAEALGISDAVFMPGRVSNPHQLMREIGSIFVLSSVFEGFGNVLPEAMGCGLAVISTDCPYGPREILTNSQDLPETPAETFQKAAYGLLTPPFPLTEADFTTKSTREEAILADAMLYLLENPADYADYVRRGKERLLDFSEEKITGQWQQYIKNQCGTERE